MNARYKEREYQYLKLLESRREGSKVKHKQLVNLSNIDHLHADRIKPLYDDLNKTLAFYKEIAVPGTMQCRFLKTAYLLALENAFRLEHRIPDRELGEILQQDGKRKHTGKFNENIFYGLVHQKAQQHQKTRGFICWLENRTCHLVDFNGFPLRFVALSEQQGEEVVNFLTNLIFNDKVPEFFLARACERYYNNFRLLIHRDKERENSLREVFVYKQLTDWSGNPGLDMEKMLVCGPPNLMDQHLNEALLAVNKLKSHLDYVENRIGFVTKGNTLPDHDLTCTSFISSLFYKMINDIIAKHNVQTALSRHL